MKRLELDEWYVDSISSVLDIKNIIKTINKVLISVGISSSNNATIKVFKGNE